jgi:hypothetical protein
MLPLSLIERLVNVLWWGGAISLLLAFYHQTIFYFHWRAYQRKNAGYVSVWLNSFALFLPHLPEECRRDRRRLLWSLVVSTAFSLLALPGLAVLRQSATQ